MKKRILFVDDERAVLDGLQRMLRPMRPEWDMVFLTSGAEALEAMGEAAFDVIVSDMRMPQMNGAELLAEVLKRFPQTVRLILSGSVDHDLVLRCVGATHQYLTKPCRPEDLQAAIARACEIKETLKDTELRKLVSRTEHVPSMPRLYLEMVEKLEDPDVGVDTIADIIAKDAGITAKILKLVNSSFFGVGRQISNPAEAVAHIGTETLKSLVLSLSAFSQFESSEIGGLSIDTEWQHSHRTAMLAQAIARAEGSERKIVDEAFVAGLLHDIGRLVLASNFPAEYCRVVEIGQAGVGPLVAAEENTFGANHAEVGAYLLGLWGLPVPVVEAIAFHHCPSRSTDNTFSALTAVHAADILATADSSATTVFDSAGLDVAYLRLLELENRLDTWRESGGSSLAE